MPVFNGERYLQYSVESILKQTYTDFELLIINDGSVDRSLEIIKSYHDPRIRLINNETNLGLVRTRNLGLSEARGEYIALLDCDDVAHPARLAKQIATMEESRELGLLGSWAYCIDEFGVKLDRLTWRPEISPDKIPAKLLFMNCFATSSVLLRKRALPETSYREDYPLAEDYDLYVRIARESRVSNLPRFLVAYRAHVAGISKTKSQQMEKCVRKIISYELEDIGIQPTERELDIHRHLDWPFLETSASLIDQAEAWLLKLYSANAHADHYDQLSFGRELGMRWFEVCNNSSHLGLWVWRRFWSAELSRHAALGWKQKIKFFVKCRLGYQRQSAA